MRRRPGLDLRRIGRRRADQESRQRQQARSPGAGRGAADRAARARRDVGEIRRLAGHRAGRKVEPEAELGEQRELEADIALGPCVRFHQHIDKLVQLVVQRRDAGRARAASPRAARRPTPSAARRSGWSSSAAAAACCSSPVKLPRCSGRRARQVDAQAVARLVDAARAAAGAAAHQPGVAAVAGGEQAHHRRALAVAAQRQHHAVVLPEHRPQPGNSIPSSR